MDQNAQFIITVGAVIGGFLLLRHDINQLNAKIDKVNDRLDELIDTLDKINEKIDIICKKLRACEKPWAG